MAAFREDAPAKQMLIPKPTKYIKDVFARYFGGITFIELGWLSLCLGLGIGLSVLFYFLIPTPVIKWTIIGVVIFIFIFLAWWLCRTRKDKIKQWKYNSSIFNYTFKNDFKKLDAAAIYSIIGIKSIDKDGTITFLKKSAPVATSLKKSGASFNETPTNIKGKLVRVEGVNINLLTNQESNIIIDKFSLPWLKLDINHKLIIVDEPINAEPMNNYLTDLINEYTPSNKSKVTESDIVRDQLLNYRDINADIQENSGVVNKGFYFLFFYETPEKLNSVLNEFASVSNISKIQYKVVDKKEKICQVLNQLYCPNSKIKWFDENQELGINKNLGFVDVEKNYLKINDQFTKIIEVRQCPTSVYAGWLQKASNYQNIQTNITILKADTETIRLNLERAKRRTNTNWQYIRSEGEIYTAAEYVEAMNGLIHDFAVGASKAWYVNIQFIISAPTLKDLNVLSNDFIKELKTVDRFVFNTMDYYQYNVFHSIFDLNMSYHTRTKTLTFCEMSNDAIGAMYPFSSNALKDDRGLFMGREAYSQDGFWFDITKKEGDRNSNVCLVCGKTGGGKSFTISKICNWLKCVGDKRYIKQYIVDPLGDYNGFLHNYENVAKIDMTNKEHGLINPLQIMDEEQDITTKASEFTVFLGMIAGKTFSAKIERVLIETLKELYKKFGITEEFNEVKDEVGEIHRIYKFAKLDASKWPTTGDFYNFLSKKFKNANPNSEEVDLVNIMWKLSDGGQYGKVWNGHTTLDTSKANMIILDTSHLDADKEPIKFKCQMYLISSFLRGEALKNRDRNLGITDINQLKWINIVVDEAHRWVKNNPIALKTLELLAREIRHHKGVLILSTQNISDFKGEPEAILKQALYHIILNMTPADVSSYNELIIESGGLTQNEKDFILTAGRGEALFSIGSQYRCYIQIQTNEIERQMWEHGKK